MDEGFALIEAGEFSLAEIYFDNILKDYPNNKTALICSARAKGLSIKKEEALSEFLILNRAYPNDIEIQLNLAEAYLWNNNFEEAKKIYKSLLNEDPKNFTANLGYANALSGSNNNYLALEFVNRALEIKPQNEQGLISKKYIMIGIAFLNTKARKYKEAHRWLDSIQILEPNQANALEIKSLIEKEKEVRAEVSRHYSKDNAGNLAVVNNAKISLGLHPRTRTNLRFIDRETSENSDLFEAKQQILMLENTFFLYPELELTIGSGLLSSIFDNDHSKHFVSSSTIAFKPNQKNYYRLGHSSTYMDYNTEIVKGNIRQDILKLEYQYFSKSKLAFYGFAAYNIQNDANHSKNLFASVYYQPLNKPILKIGTSLNYLNFKENNQLLYFSPESYYLAEIFFHIENLNSGNSKYFYKVLIAPGKQKIEQLDWQNTIRLDLQFGRQITKAFSLNLFYSFSNTVQINGAGNFKFQNYGISLKSHF